jgi:glycosyltransferase involved in cell wall biosynthesis
VNEIKFVIGVPTYNRSHLISRVYESVLKQGYENWILLFIDDGSSDTTEDTLKALSEKDSRVAYRGMGINSGVNKVRNRIIEIATILDSSAFLLLIDDDDYLGDSCLKLAAKAMKKAPTYNWYTMNCDYENSQPISKISKYGELSYLDNYMFGKGIRGDLTHILRLSTIGDVRFTTEFKNAEEWFFWCNLSAAMPLYAINETGSTKEYLEEGLTDQGMNRDRAIEVLEFKIRSLEPLVGRYKLAHQYISLVKLNLKSKEVLRLYASLDLLKKVFQVKPWYFRQYRYWIKILIAYLSFKVNSYVR